MRPIASLVILLLVSACGEAGDRAAATGPAQPDAAAKPDTTAKPDTPVKPDEATEPEPKPKPEPLSAKRASELRKQFRTKLDEGRKLTKAGKHEDGIKLYHEALAIEPSNPTALAELGWAALQANQLDLAQGATSQALTFSRKSEQQGMILYNLGRVAEARGETNDAIVRYRESLERRPNQTVQSRLDGLLATATNLPAPSEGLGRLASGVADLDAACKLLVAEECANLYTIEEDGCSCTTSSSDEADGWALLALGESHTVENAMWFPAVATSSGWVVFDSIAWVYNPGAFGIWEDASWDEPASTDLIAGGDPEWVLAFSKNRSDTDMGVNEYETETYAMSVVCAREGAEAWCTEPLLRESSYMRDVEFKDEEYEGADEIEHEGLPIEKKFSCKLELGAKLVVSEVVGDAGTGWSGNARTLAAGEHDLATLLGKASAPK